MPWRCGELRLRDGLTEPARRSEPAPQSCVFPARTNPIVSQFGHVPELDQPRLGPLSNWQVAPKASLWSYLECPFLVLDACKAQCDRDLSFIKFLVRQLKSNYY